MTRSTERDRAGFIANRNAFLRFLVTGVINTLASYAVYVAALRFLAYPLAYTVSYLAGIVMSYCLNLRYVFREKARFSHVLKYPLVYLFQYLLGLGLVYVLVEKAHISKYLAPALIVVISIPVTFLLTRYVLSAPPLPSGVTRETPLPSRPTEAPVTRV